MATLDYASPGTPKRRPRRFSSRREGGKTTIEAGPPGWSSIRFMLVLGGITLAAALLFGGMGINALMESWRAPMRVVDVPAPMRPLWWPPREPAPPYEDTRWEVDNSPKAVARQARLRAVSLTILPSALLLLAAGAWIILRGWRLAHTVYRLEADPAQLALAIDAPNGPKVRRWRADAILDIGVEAMGRTSAWGMFLTEQTGRRCCLVSGFEQLELRDMAVLLREGLQSAPPPGGRPIES